MVYTIRSRVGNEVATLRSWNGEITATRSPSGHWTWCKGRKVETVLRFALDHYMSWEVSTDETTWDKVEENAA